MGYVKANLLADERIEYAGKTSLWSLLPQILLGLLLLPIYGFGLVFWLAAAVRYLTTEMVITNRRIMAKFGFIRRETLELNLRRAESIRIDHGILGRVFNYGSIVVSGVGNPQTPIPGVASPLVFRKHFLEAQEVAERNGATDGPMPMGHAGAVVIT